ncbi:hypothetical protein [Nocardia australiensis]|uniref:hypothetical protein n=1 Tax=Nocardia australiensis TaxID=2887191 RepID=UPI001D15BA4E|nr:hypothetical protein [Nocardia australiensis]
MSNHAVLGKEIRMPVRIRFARAFMASYVVPTVAAQRLIDYLGDHAIATELASLGLPKSALMVSVVDRLAMTYPDAITV